MTVAEEVDRVFAFFGKNGKNWTNYPATTAETGKGCLVQAVSESATTGRVYVQMYKKLSPLADFAGVGEWNDRQTWPTIRKLLNSIKYRKPFRG